MKRLQSRTRRTRFALHFNARSDVWMAVLTCVSRTLGNQPAKLAIVVSMLPSFMCAAFMDAYPHYPAEGRAGTSRLFFTLNLVGLVLLQVGRPRLRRPFGIARIDEFVVEMYGGWRFKASELAGGAISNLIPFSLRNLVASMHRPDTLAVRQSDVVCAYLDEHAHAPWGTRFACCAPCTPSSWRTRALPVRRATLRRASSR